MSENLNSKTETNKMVERALFEASKEGDDVSLKSILSFVDVYANSLDCYGRTPLFTPMMYNNSSTVRILLAHPDTRLDIADIMVVVRYQRKPDLS
jgi:hypothetical protein